MIRIHDPSFCKEYNVVIGNSCSQCENENVKLIGTYIKDDKGIFIDVECRKCGWIGEDGDANFFDHYKVTDEGISHL
jgi:ABC-type molybdate transport system ATPase subunit